MAVAWQEHCLESTRILFRETPFSRAPAMNHGAYPPEHRIRGTWDGMVRYVAIPGPHDPITPEAV